MKPLHKLNLISLNNESTYNLISLKHYFHGLYNGYMNKMNIMVYLNLLQPFFKNKVIHFMDNENYLVKESKLKEDKVDSLDMALLLCKECCYPNSIDYDLFWMLITIQNRYPIVNIGNKYEFESVIFNPKYKFGKELVDELLNAYNRVYDKDRTNKGND